MSVMQALLIALFVAAVESRALGYATLTMRFSPLMAGFVVGLVLGNMPLAMTTVATIQLIYMGVVAPGGAMPSEPCIASAMAVSTVLVGNLEPEAAVAIAVPVGLLGSYLDHKGKGATMLIFGAILMTVCHLIFAFVLPAYPSTLIAYGAIIILGISFSLVPAALWPSVPKIMETRYLGSAYSLIFWIQNIGLCLFPAVIGYALKFSNPGHIDGTAYNYTLPMVIFASCGVVAMLLGIWLKAEDRRKHYGLELPNIKK